MPRKTVRTGKKTLPQRMDRMEKMLQMLMDEIRDVRLELKADIRELNAKIDRNHADLLQKSDTIQRFIVRIETERLPERVLALEHRVFKVD